MNNKTNKLDVVGDMAIPWEPKIIDYKIIEGFPEFVQNQVKSLLQMRWQPYGLMYIIKAPGNREIDIAVQCMVLYEDYSAS